MDDHFAAEGVHANGRTFGRHALGERNLHRKPVVASVLDEELAVLHFEGSRGVNRDPRWPLHARRCAAFQSDFCNPAKQHDGLAGLQPRAAARECLGMVHVIQAGV